VLEFRSGQVEFVYKLTLFTTYISIYTQVRLVIMSYTDLNHNTLNDDSDDLNKDMRLNIYEDS